MNVLPSTNKNQYILSQLLEAIGLYHIFYTQFDPSLTLTYICVKVHTIQSDQKHRIYAEILGNRK